MIDALSVLLSRLTAARAAVLDAAISSRLTSIKSIQYGTITLPNTATAGTATATITSVDTTKAMLFWLGQTEPAENTVVADLILTNATTVTSATGWCQAQTVSFVIVEWN